MTSLISKNLITRLPIFFLLVTFLSVNTQAQDYGTFEWDIVRLGSANPSNTAASTMGASISTEPRFNISNKFSAGLRLAVDAYGSSPAENIVDVGVSASVYLLGDYYFSNKGNKRAFAGLGIGKHAGGEVRVEEDEEIKDENTEDFGTYYGITPRIGYEFGILRISGEYNFTLDNAVPNVLGVHFGLTIGGRKKK